MPKAPEIDSQKLAKRRYKHELKRLQIGLVTLQRHLIKNNLKLLVIFEGRDAAGKDGVIKRITEHLSPRETRVVALPKPSDQEQKAWYFRRFAIHLPTTQEMILMNRSWYNRAGVERVMNYCTSEQYDEFINSVGAFEAMLVESGHQLVKYYLDISKQEQIRRLQDRERNPLKQWKVSPVDKVAVQKWELYSRARDDMLVKTSFDWAPWYVVRADNKWAARLNIIRHLLSVIECPDKSEHLTNPDDSIVYKFEASRLDGAALAL